MRAGQPTNRFAARGLRPQLASIPSTLCLLSGGWGGGELGKGSVLTEGYPHHIPTSKSQPAACLLPGIDTSGGREWFNPNRVWTAPPVRAVILLGWRAGPCKPEGARPCPLCART